MAKRAHPTLDRVKEPIGQVTRIDRLCVCVCVPVCVCVCVGVGVGVGVFDSFSERIRLSPCA